MGPNPIASRFVRPRRSAIEPCSIPAELFFGLGAATRAHRSRGLLHARLFARRLAARKRLTTGNVRALHALTQFSGQPGFSLSEKTGLTLENVGTRIFLAIFANFWQKSVKKNRANSQKCWDADFFGENWLATGPNPVVSLHFRSKKSALLTHLDAPMRFCVAFAHPSARQ